MNVKLNYCKYEGLLVNGTEWIPSAPYDYFWSSRAGFGFFSTIGCNNLLCSKCGEHVRNKKGFKPKEECYYNKDTKLPDLYDCDDWTNLPYLTYNENCRHRLYACRCSWKCIEHSAIALADREEDWHTWWPLPEWKCGGHQYFKIPGNIDGIEITEETDFSKIVSDVFSGKIKINVHKELLAFRAFWVERLYHLLTYFSSVAGRISEAIALCLMNPDPFIMSCAIEFFKNNPMAPGSEKIIKVAQHNLEMFKGIKVPFFEHHTLEEYLLEAIALRLLDQYYHNDHKVDEGERKLVHHLVFRSHQDYSLLAALCIFDTQWVIEHAEKIVTAAKNPGEAAGKLLSYINRLAPQYRSEIINLTQRLISIPKLNKNRFRQMIRDLLNDPEKSTILNLIRENK